MLSPLTGQISFQFRDYLLPRSVSAFTDLLVLAVTLEAVACHQWPGRDAQNDVKGKLFFHSWAWCQWPTESMENFIDLSCELQNCVFIWLSRKQHFFLHLIFKILVQRAEKYAGTSKQCIKLNMVCFAYQKETKNFNIWVNQSVQNSYLLGNFLHLIHICYHGTLPAHFSQATPCIPNTRKYKETHFTEISTHIKTNKKITLQTGWNYIYSFSLASGWPMKEQPASNFLVLEEF